MEETRLEYPERGIVKEGIFIAMAGLTLLVRCEHLTKLDPRFPSLFFVDQTSTAATLAAHRSLRLLKQPVLNEHII